MAAPPAGTLHRLQSLYTLVLLLAVSPVWAQAITIHNAWLSASPPTSRITSAYFEIENHGHEDVVIDRISSPDFHRIEIHRSILTDGVAGMRQEKEVRIPVDGRRVFSPGGLHLMLYRNLAPLKIGESTTITLHFSDGNTLRVTAPVKTLDERQRHHHH